MRTHCTHLVALLPLVLNMTLASCENSRSSPSDAGTPTDAQHPGDASADASADAQRPDSGNPADTPPILGAQIDRAGRPAINALLNGLLAATDVDKKNLEDAYGQAPIAADWPMYQIATNISIAKEFAMNIAIYDAIDLGLSQILIPNNGCGNTAAYNGPPKATSYAKFASLLADDQIYVDISQTICTVYLSLDIETIGQSATYNHTDCGGRTPTYDVVDVTYSILSAGLDGLDKLSVPQFAGKLHDGASAHTDVSNTVFPFFGSPH